MPRATALDASVQAMVAMPDVLNRLTEDIHWTTDLETLSGQQADVMAPCSACARARRQRPN